MGIGDWIGLDWIGLDCMEGWSYQSISASESTASQKSTQEKFADRTIPSSSVYAVQHPSAQFQPSSADAHGMSLSCSSVKLPVPFKNLKEERACVIEASVKSMMNLHTRAVPTVPTTTVPHVHLFDRARLFRESRRLGAPIFLSCVTQPHLRK